MYVQIKFLEGSVMLLSILAHRLKSHIHVGHKLSRVCRTVIMQNVQIKCFKSLQTGDFENTK